MTVCNMSIEAGARAGHDRARRHDVRLPRGPARRAARRRRGSARSTSGARCAPTTARRSTRRSTSTSRALKPQVTWGTNPGMVAPVDGVVPDPADYADPDEREAVERALRYMDLDAGHAARATSASTRSSSARARTRASRTCAPRRRSSPAGASPTACSAIVVPGSAQVKRQAEEEGLREVFERAGFEWRRAGCSMCLGMNPDILAARRALRVDVEPQLRGPAGRGRAHASRSAPRWPPPPRSTGRFTDVRELA